jgi:hypothetical protein
MFWEQGEDPLRLMWELGLNSWVSF